jgi:deazaflavin-dependent oxidoreductase (nitroreductase family)
MMVDRAIRKRKSHMSFVIKPPNRLQRVFQHVPASRLGAWIFARTLHPLDRLLLRLSRGRVSVPGVVAGLPVVMLTSIGAKTGQPRTVPLVGLRDGDKVVVIASNFGQTHHPGWYYNLRAHPEATLELLGRSGAYLAREATPAEWQKYWQRAADLYIGFPASQQHARGRTIPIIVLTPIAK